MEINTIVKLIEQLGVPIVVLGFAGWYIKFLQLGFAADQVAAQKERTDLQDGFTRERTEMRQQDIENDRQLVEIVKTTSDAFTEMKTALAEQTSTMRELLGRLDTKRRK